MIPYTPPPLPRIALCVDGPIGLSSIVASLSAEKNNNIVLLPGNNFKNGVPVLPATSHNITNNVIGQSAEQNNNTLFPSEGRPYRRGNNRKKTKCRKRYKNGK